jgi:FlaA1/EpsC-like NDP-sugar epimerase
MDIAHGRVEMTHLRDVDIKDLLGREPVEPDRELMQRSIAGKVVMVTGAGGSIGGEICRQLLSLELATLLLFEISEFNLYEIHRELRAAAAAMPGSVRIVPLLGSVTDEARVEEVVATWRPDVIYHAAAYKHVPIIEHNPAEGVRTNVLGTLTMAKAAARWSVASFTLISTDKAVRPTNVMGVTKRIAELVVQALAQNSPPTCFSIVRFGNVLDTSGSVVPLFRHQIRNRGPVTLTDWRITRYFMTAPEAAELVLQASAMACGGDVFVLDMGEPVRIQDLATNMIELAGLTVRNAENPDGDVEIVEIGLRPGEKLYEELLIGNNPSPTDHPRIFKAHEACLSFERLRGKLERLETLLDAARRPDLLAVLKELVPEFEKQDGLVDWVCVEAEQLLAGVPIAKSA